ncbi:uncharacterized protein LOC128266957 [Anopheles cruzii]|uniref:uncharacterized protein LOC128266957 n=1 Tax=Anopheles cruzii TaxID=68878 RepID=UPI0022EC9120|nr:uncharacterized protein LOC128266957 [Anopheles cruzii]
MSQGNEIKSKTESNVLESGPQIVEISFPDDGLYTGPTTKTATRAEDGSIMSDDENRTLTTLEAPPKPPIEVPNAGSSDAARKLLKQAQERKLPSVKSSVRKDGVMHHAPKKQMIVSKPAVRLPSKEDLIQKIRGRLSKSIEPKPESITPAKPKTLDSSGAIEIPTDMILSSDIPATTLPSAEADEIELEDHDLIAILEGNDVEIRCVAKASGRIEEDEDETMVEEMQITIMDGEEMHQAQLARDKEIARRQIESLPTLQKGRPRSRTKLEDAPELQQANTTTTNNSPVVHSKPISGGVTIGQTTIRAIPKKTTVAPLDTPLATDSGQIVVKQESKPKHIEKLIQPTRKPSEIKKPPKVAVPKAAAAVQSELSVAKLIKSPYRNPVVVVKKSPLIDSLVSDWDEEQVVMAPELKTEKDTVAGKPSQSTAMSATQEDGTQFIAPSSTIEPVKRVKKKKIIWDPSDSSIPFAALVKAGRNQQPTGESTSNVRPTDPGTATMRRKRADSVAVHMIEERSRRVDHVPVERKRALTPEPIKTTEEGFPKHTLKPEPSPVVIDLKAKKRKNEIERLLGDEGAINMLYDVECETTRKDLLKDGEVDTSDEDEKLLAKTKIITDVVIKQSKLPNENSSTSQALRVRTKRASTPSQSPSGGGLEIRLSESPKAMAAEIKVANNNNNNNPTTARATATRKRKNTSIGKGWDYVYNAQGGEDAMIIRRRSNSSYSSSASSRRLSIDLSASEKAATPVAPSERQEEPPAADTNKEKFLFAKPTKKTASPPEVKVDVKLLSSMKDVMSKALKIGALKQDTTKGKARSTPNRSKSAPKGSDAIVNGSDQTLQKHLEQLKELVCTKYDSFVELGLKTQGVRVDLSSVAEHETNEPLQDVFSFVVMNELRETLTLLENDESVHAVLLRSEGTNFSRGLDVGYLIQPPETLEETAQTMSECLKNFLKVLLSFSKPIVAAIHGEVIGMGVMLLPTFDLVIAQSGTMLSAPYGHLGYLPEALKAFSSCQTVRNKAITELLLLGKRITCYTGLEYGLVTDVVIPERLYTRARSLTKTLATRSAQAIQSTKKHLRYELLMNLDTILALEQKQHAKQWTTAECQTMFKKFVEKGGVL